MRTRGKTNVEEILHPVNGYRGALERKGVIPKDHQKENMKLLKEKRQEYVDKQEKIQDSKKESTRVFDK